MASPNRQQNPSVRRVTRKRQNQQPLVLNGLCNSYEDRSGDFLCPICFDIIEEAHMTKCGHSFCFKCIQRSLDQSNRCPKCNFTIDGSDQIFPNFLLNELILKHKEYLEFKRMKLDLVKKYGGTSQLHDFLNQEADNLDLVEVNSMLEVLVQKKQQLEADCRAAQIELLREFLQQVRTHKQEQLEQLNGEMRTIDEDTKRVQEMLTSEVLKNGSPEVLVKGEASFASEASGASEERGNSSTPKPQDGFNGGGRSCVKQHWLVSTTAARRRRMHAHFDDLEQCYLTIRCRDLSAGDDSDGLHQFEENLAKFTKYSSIRPLATLSYASDMFSGSSIVSSIEFDKDNEFFAIAGVTKKIKVFEYGAVVKDTVDMHYPITEMVCNSKISCVSWSCYHKNMLASSDYEGTVTIWDAFTGSKTRVFQEHEKRCWSVDFNQVDTKLVASGSDDAKVKLWCTNMEHSITSLEAKANVCCVKFNPKSRYHLAFGSADHCVHYFDLRNLKQALCVFKGHRKAVSYAKFLNPEEIVSASTDSQLKLWNVNKPHCLKSFKGHTNEKNFVGLATDGDYIACGSENNSLYIYYKGLSKQLLTFKFDSMRSVMEKDKKEDDVNEFVSAVCWRQGCDVLVAANSQGTIKVLQLV